MVSSFFLLLSCRGQRILTEAQDSLKESEKRRDENLTKMDKTMKKMIEVKSGIEHLADKLHHLKATKSQVPTSVISSQSNDYVLDLLGTTEEKLVKLVEELEAKDLDATLKEMRQLDVRTSLSLRSILFMFYLASICW